jgi:DNA-binding LacI/PurR family transcriptional regulator
MPACRWCTASGVTPVRRVHVVGIDNVECGRMAARELVAARLSRRGLSGRAGIGNLDAGPVSRLHGRARAPPRHFGAHTFAEAYSFNAGARRCLLRLNDKPAQAYFCGDDVLSIGALSAIIDSGLKVPDDIG